MKTKQKLIKQLNLMGHTNRAEEVIAEVLIDIRDALMRSATVLEGIEDHMARDCGKK